MIKALILYFDFNETGYLSLAIDAQYDAATYCLLGVALFIVPNHDGRSISIRLDARTARVGHANKLKDITGGPLESLSPIAPYAAIQSLYLPTF
ncbi:hypothetical protein ACLOJK_011092 [Asimina triloba]